MSRYSETHQFDTEGNYPIIEIPEPLPGEYWRPISNNGLKYTLLPYYAMSNFGRIIHRFTHSFMKSSWDGGGYRIAVLRTFEAGAKTFRVHRLLMLTFRYYEGCENLEVNHKNGNKSMNFIDCPVYDPLTQTWKLMDNLEWTDHQQNMEHAFETGLVPKNHATKYTKMNEDIVENICKLLAENNLSNLEIAMVLGVSLHDVENVKYKRSWRHISDKYIFPHKKYAPLTEAVVNKICEMLAKGIDMKTISEECNVGYDSVKAIKNKRAWVQISNNYNF